MSIPVILAILAVILISTALPLAVMARLAKAGGSWKDFFVGAAVFFLFAMVLERLLHLAVLNSGAGTAIQGTLWLYGLYGGLAAGVFEETGRFLAFRWVLRDRRDRCAALSYGIGHGGMEAFLVVGLTMASNLVLGLTYARGGSVPQELVPALDSLLEIPASTFLWSGLERVSAMILHMAFSVLVFAAVRGKKIWLYPAAVLMHGAVDFAAVMCNARLPVAATELVVLAMTAAAALWAARIYKSLPAAGEAL